MRIITLNVPFCDLCAAIVMQHKEEEYLFALWGSLVSK